MIPLGCRRSLVFLKEASDAEFERQRIRCQYPTRYVIIHLVILLQTELRVLTKKGLDAHAASFDLPSRLIACSSGRSQSQ